MTLRAGFFYPSGMMRLPVDPASVWTSPRGLTGSELACVMYAVGLSELGREVTLFMNFTNPGRIGRVTCCPYQEWEETYCRQEWDALCAWMSPEPLRLADPSQFRLFNQQVSDFNMCEPGWEKYVDFLAPLSSSHARYMAPSTAFPRDRWRVMHDGVDAASFRPGRKVPGKMVWASSHDRGLHWLLEAFPAIRREVPWAELHVFYDFEGLRRYASMDGVTGLLAELSRRSRYTREALRRLEGHGVHAHGSVSRDRIKEEMASAEVLAYPLDPVHYTETFGVTVLEACASGTVPVLCTADAFGELWGPASLSVPPPYREHKDEFRKLVVDVLTDRDLRESSASRCVGHAALFEWKKLVRQLDEFLETRGESGLPHVDWESGV